MRRNAAVGLAVVWLAWYGVAIPCRLVAEDARFWRAGFMRDEMTSLILLAVGTVCGFVGWGWWLLKARDRGNDTRGANCQRGVR